MPSVYEIVTDRIITAMEQGIVPWQKPWGTDTLPINFVSKKHYNGINILLLGINSYTCPYWATYKQITELGGIVKKGEHGTPVVFWKVIPVKGKDNIEGEDLNEKNQTRFLLRYYLVFNLEQTEGIEIPVTKKIDKIDTCEKFITNTSSRFANIKHENQTKACYNSTKDEINVPHINQFINSPEYYSTLFHEIIHSTGHESRLGRFKEENSDHIFGSESYSKEELIAEIGATFLCHRNGIENTVKNSAAYIQNWLQVLKNDKRMIVFAASQAQKATEYITNEKEIKGE